MRPWIIIPLTLAAMAAVMYVAVRADCVRIAEEYESEVQLVDAEMRKLEESWGRLVYPGENYRFGYPGERLVEAKTVDERHEVFRTMATSIRDRWKSRLFEQGTISLPVDETNGLLNRWQRLESEYLQRVAERDAYLNSWRGEIANAR